MYSDHIFVGANSLAWQSIERIILGPNAHWFRDGDGPPSLSSPPDRSFLATVTKADEDEELSLPVDVDLHPWFPGCGMFGSLTP